MFRRAATPSKEIMDGQGSRCVDPALVGAGNTAGDGTMSDPGARFESLLPVAYSDSTVVSAVYLINSSAAREVMDDPKLHPLILPGKRSVVVITLFDFRASSIGPYREMSIGVLANSARTSMPGVLAAIKGLSSAGAWILALPVDSPVAYRGGVELFGYPKTLNRIQAQVSNGKCSYSVYDREREVVAVDLPLGRGPRVPVRHLVTYSSLNGDLIETKIPVRWFPTISSGRGVTMRLGSTDHPIVNAICRLGLPNAPTFVLHGCGFEATLDARNSRSARVSRQGDPL